MGMSASQARLLSLQARQSNLEYQGQQINQERTILSQQCTELYNSLLAMTVPTPPSTQDYTTIQYSGVNGADSFTIGTVKPSGDTAYVVEMQRDKTGDSLQTLHGSYRLQNAGADMYGEYPATTSVKTSFGQVPDGTEHKEGDFYVSENEADYVSGADLSEQGANPADYVLAGDTTYAVVTQFDPSKQYVKKTDKATYDQLEDKSTYSHVRKYEDVEALEVTSEVPGNFYVVDENGKATKATFQDFVKKDGAWYFDPNKKYFEEKEGGSETATNPNAGALTVGGSELLTFEQAKQEYGSAFEDARYENAIRNTYGESLTKDDFYVYTVTSDTGVTEFRFVLKSDAENGDDWVEASKFSENGKYTESEQKDGCKLTFDSAGRITSISVPTAYSADGNIIAYQDIKLTAETVTDNAAYEDAYNEYQYAQYEYDRLQQEINAKTEIIQQQDRNLELKLQRLDNERTQITTEIEAVEKVINDNIESSYKTFSG